MPTPERRSDRPAVAATWRATAFFLASIALMSALATCRPPAASGGGEVVLYVSADEFLARQVIAAFEREQGVRVRFVGDTEATKTTGLANRLRQEKDNPQADVYWSSEIFLTVALAGEGLFDEHISDAAADWPRQHRDGQRRWHAFAARPRVIVYAPDRVAADSVPNTWMNLTWDRFRGRIVMADPRFGTTGGHLAAMKAYWNADIPGFYEAYLLGLKENDILLLPSGNAGVVRAVASGEADIGLTDADDVWAAQANGANVALVYPRHSVDEEEPGNGTLLIPNTVARVRGGPNPGNAARLIDFLLSQAVERMIAESSSHNIPLNPALEGAYPQYAVDDPLQVDFERAAAVRESAIAQAMDLLADGARSDGSDAP